MSAGIDQICHARLCADCRVQMVPHYLMLQVKDYTPGVCDRCGKSRLVSVQRYMRKRRPDG